MDSYQIHSSILHLWCLELSIFTLMLNQIKNKIKIVNACNQIYDASQIAYS